MSKPGESSIRPERKPKHKGVKRHKTQDDTPIIKPNMPKNSAKLETMKKDFSTFMGDEAKNTYNLRSRVVCDQGEPSGVFLKEQSAKKEETLSRELTKSQEKKKKDKDHKAYDSYMEEPNVAMEDEAKDELEYA